MKHGRHLLISAYPRKINYKNMIHIFCALPCEAQSIIQNFKLTELKQFNLFRIYQSKDKEINLTITGIGKINTAAAVSYHHACMQTNTSDVWLNIGVAGHANIAVGEARLINKVTDEHDNTHWYPQIIFNTPCDSANLITLDKPSTDYQDVLFDMEASAFYQIAIRLGTAELIHCLKIVSDNSEQSTETVNADKVKKLIAAHTKTIEDLINALKPMSNEIRSIISEPDHFQYCIEKWHFTQSERFQLSRLLHQWAIRLPETDVVKSVDNSTTGKAVLNTLRDKINTSEFVIHD
jgi:hypothetical protein